jgi:hypothetical protein
MARGGFHNVTVHKVCTRTAYVCETCVDVVGVDADNFVVGVVVVVCCCGSDTALRVCNPFSPYQRWHAVASDLQVNPDRSDAGYRLRLHYTKNLSNFESAVREAVSMLAAGRADTVTVQMARLATMTCDEHHNAVAASVARRNGIHMLVAAALSAAEGSRDVATHNQLSGIVASRATNNNKLPGCTSVAASLPRARLWVAIGNTPPPLLPSISAILSDNGDSASVKCGKRNFSLVASALYDTAPERRVTHDFHGSCAQVSTLHVLNSNRDAHTSPDVSAADGCSGTDQEIIGLFIQRLRSSDFAMGKNFKVSMQPSDRALV